MKPSSNNVFVVTAVHNDKKLTEEFIGSIKKSNYNNIKIVVVDDGSTDGTEELINHKYPEVKVIKGDGNLWWTGAMEKAVNYVLLKAEASDFILTINNDCILDNNYIKTIVSSGLRNKRSLIGSVIKDIGSKEIFDAGVIVDWSKGKIEAKILKDKNTGIDKMVDVLSTKGTLFPVRVFKEIGNFNFEKLPHYLSDYEYTCRARKHGWNLIVDYDCLVWNHKDRTGKEKHDEDVISFGEFKDVLLNRRSKNNIIDRINFIGLCCPRKYLFINYFLIVVSFFYYLSFVKPFYFFRPLIRKVNNY